jgi:hypothetical protein
LAKTWPVKSLPVKTLASEAKLDSIPGLYGDFHERLKSILSTNRIGGSETPDSSVPNVTTDLQIVAEQIYSEYFKENKREGFTNYHQSTWILV